jgi:uncharacterized protein YprB with RNaseH-like and TPR domain
MIRRRNYEEINKKCELLESLGFEIEHEDSRVSFNGHSFDFSAIACDEASIMKTALKAMFEHGREHGKEEIREGFRKLMQS